MSYNNETWQTYTLLKEGPKNIWITWHTPWVLLTSAFFTGNQQILLPQEIRIQIAIWDIISNSFKFSWVFKDCLNEHGYNFDNVSKNGYPRPSWNKGFLKQRLWRHNFFPWHHQHDFIPWFKLYCRCGHVTKVWWFYERSCHNFNFIRIWPEKLLVLRGALGSSLIIWDWH